MEIPAVTEEVAAPETAPVTETAETPEAVESASEAPSESQETEAEEPEKTADELFAEIQAEAEDAQDKEEQ